MKIHANVTQANGAINIILQPSFVGDLTDTNDKQLIAAFGDPEVNIAGSFTDPSNTSFTFQFPTTENYVGITTQLSSQVASFTVALPSGPPYQPAPIQGAMMCITPNPSEAAQVWVSVVESRIQQAMMALRSKTLLPTIPDITV